MPETNTVQVQDVPCTIEHSNGRVFVVEDFDSWGYTPTGIFACGRWLDAPADADPTDVMIPYAKWELSTFDFAKVVARDAVIAAGVEDEEFPASIEARGLPSDEVIEGEATDVDVED